VKFLLVGGTIFIINTITLWLLKRILLWDNLISAATAYLFALVFHFLLTNFFTFNDSNVIYKRRILGYLFTAACNYIINIIVVTCVLTYIIDNVLAATIASTAITMSFTFFMLNKIMYTKKTGV